MNLNSRVLVGTVGMILRAQTIDRGIDLNGVNVFGAPLQSPADIVTRTRTDDHHITKGRPSGVTIQQVWQSVSWILVISRNHRLVKHQVHRKRQVSGLEINSVV